MKQSNKKILYLLFNSYPSAWVRGKIYQQHYESVEYIVHYEDVFSPFLESLLTFAQSKIVFRILRKILTIIQSFYVSLQLKRILLIAKEYDVVIVIKSANAEFIKKLKQSTTAKLVYDFDDSIWLPYFYGKKIFMEIISNVDFVTCDNKYLAKKAMEYNSNSFVVNGPAQIDLALKSERTRSESDPEIILGWIGSQSTLFYLYSILDPLEILGNKYPKCKLQIVGCGINYRQFIPSFENIRCEFIPNYSKNEMFGYVKNFDIGLYPLFNNEMSLGRGFLKATIYMSAGVPVVLSRLGCNIDLVKDGVNGLLASNTDEWVTKMSLLIEKPNLRLSIGKAGAKTVAEQLNTKMCFMQIKSQILDTI